MPFLATDKLFYFTLKNVILVDSSIQSLWIWLLSLGIMHLEFIQEVVDVSIFLLLLLLLLNRSLLHGWVYSSSFTRWSWLETVTLDSLWKYCLHDNGVDPSFISIWSIPNIWLEKPISSLSSGIKSWSSEAPSSKDSFGSQNKCP